MHGLENSGLENGGCEQQRAPIGWKGCGSWMGGVKVTEAIVLVRGNVGPLLGGGQGRKGLIQEV